MESIPLFRVLMNPEANKILEETLSSGYIGQGPRVDMFEAMLTNILQSGDRIPVTVNSCTSALDLALGLIGVGPGDEVISTAMTCWASNSVIVNRGAKIVWADIDNMTGLIKPEDVANKITSKTKAIMAVNWAGRYCDYKTLKSFGVPVIEDAAHCFGQTPDIERGDYIAYSFQAIKFLTTGDGGCLITPPEKEEEARILRWYGLDRTKGESFRCTQNIKKSGYKYHMNDIAASIGIANATTANNAVTTHRENARLMTELLQEEGLCVTPPPWNPNCCYWLYSLLTDIRVDRDEFSKYLIEKGIANSPVHFRNDRYDCTLQFESKEPLLGLNWFANRQLNIPIGWWVTEGQIEYIADVIQKYRY